MTSDRWEKINRLYDSAVEMEEKERASFLGKACGEDVELRHEVESLLTYGQQAQHFLDRPAFEVAAEKLASEPPSLVGRQFGPYQILGLLGAGGMGEVFTARDTRLNRTVAIKVLPKHFSERADLRQRFEREARTIASLNHPHICALYDIGQEGKIDFLVMEYLEGETLSLRLKRGPLQTEEVLRYAVEIAGALEQAHRKRVVHRDLKPGNIVLTEAGAKLLDFGLAKQTGGVDALRTLTNARRSARSTQGESLTEEGMILGTLEYMAPEQLEGKEADARTDLFALGVVIYEMATGQKAFQAESKASASLTPKIRTAQPPPIATIQPVSPPELDRVVQRCLAKKPEERWQSAAELSLKLQEIAEANLEILKTLQSTGGKTKSHIGVQGDLDKRDDGTEASPASCSVSEGLIGKWRRAGVWPSSILPLRWWLALLAALLLVVGAVWYRDRTAGLRWARTAGLPQIRHLVKKGELVEAFQLIREVERYLPRDAETARLRREYGQRILIRTSQLGANVYLKDYMADGEWEFLGKSPVESFQNPFALFRVRVTMPGFEPCELGSSRASVLDIRLFPEGSSPRGMVFVPGGYYVGYYRLHPFNASTAEVPEFWIDKYEVTNRQYKEFVDAGGYRDPKFWKVSFLKNGQLASWEAAMAEFGDSTGYPGPSTWTSGSYPEGADDFPVSGVSWFEAAAYAEFAGKTLPTLHHWYKAAGLESPLLTYPMLQLSNIEKEAPAAVGSYRGLGFYGTYDMLGNVKEWCWNSAGPQRYILGGAWSDPAYVALTPENRSPFDRSPTNGFRCIKSVAPLQAGIEGPVEFRRRDLSKTKTLNEAVFRAYRAMYSYDRTFLDPIVEAVEETPRWRREKISFTAAYGQERVAAYLFLPRTERTLHQTVVYCPTLTALLATSSENLQVSLVEFLVRSGRAVMYPIYKGTYERGGGHLPLTGDTTERDRIIHWSKDLSRSVDYLETRADIDRERLAFYGVSLGAYYGPILTQVDHRFKTSVLLAGGLFYWAPLPEIDPFHFAPRNPTPTLMVNGWHDFSIPVETSQVPFFQLLGAPEGHKRRAVLEGGHFPARFQEAAKEILAWLDQYLGTVRLSTEQ